jgi:hypothetical protein
MRNARTETHVVTLTAEPPPIATPVRPDLHALLDAHWPTRFPLVDYGRSMAVRRGRRARRSGGGAGRTSRSGLRW